MFFPHVCPFDRTWGDGVAVRHASLCSFICRFFFPFAPFGSGRGLTSPTIRPFPLSFFLRPDSPHRPSTDLSSTSYFGHPTFFFPPLQCLFSRVFSLCRIFLFPFEFLWSILLLLANRLVWRPCVFPLSAVVVFPLVPS